MQVFVNIDLAIKALAIIGVMYIIARIAAPFINDFFNPYKSKKNSHDLDSMIKRKEEYLRVTGAAGTVPNASTIATSKSKKEIKKADYIDLVKSEFTYLSQKQNKTDLDKDHLVEFKKVLNLLDSLQWGQSEELTSLRRKFEKYFDFAVDEAVLIKSMRYALIHAHLVQEVNEKQRPAGYEDLAESVITISLHEIIKNTFVTYDFKDAVTLSKRWHTSVAILQKAWILWLYEKTNIGSKDIVENLVAFNEPIKATDIMSLFGFGIDSLPWKSILHDSDKIRKTNDVIDSIKEELATIKAINKLPDSESLNQKLALDLLGFEAIPAPGVLSRRYKRLARIMHPDRIASKGFPSEVMQQVNDNFRTIKAAYELLKAEQE